MVITGDLVDNRVHWKPESSTFSIVGHKPQITGADPGIFLLGVRGTIFESENIGEPLFTAN